LSEKSDVHFKMVPWYHFFGAKQTFVQNMFNIVILTTLQSLSTIIFTETHIQPISSCVSVLFYINIVIP